ncbi:CASP-like protein 4A2 [Miscanthus floridulus]|uniref:CASP-like protein 4A2 n=1 Tax=Miscanthus floridulus TaxID=154761 RepID=UPI00345AF54A
MSLSSSPSPSPSPSRAKQSRALPSPSLAHVPPLAALDRTRLAAPTHGRPRRAATVPRRRPAPPRPPHAPRPRRSAAPAPMPCRCPRWAPALRPRLVRRVARGRLGRAPPRRCRDRAALVAPVEPDSPRRTPGIPHPSPTTTIVGRATVGPGRRPDLRPASVATSSMFADQSLER